MTIELNDKELDMLSRSIATEAMRCCDKYREELHAFIETSKNEDIPESELAEMAGSLDETKAREAKKIEDLMELIKKLGNSPRWGRIVKSALDEMNG